MITQFLADMLKPHLTVISYFVIVLVGNMLTGLFVNIGDGWGKIRGSNSFQPKSKIMIVFIIEAIIIAMTLDYVTPIFQLELEKITIYFPAIILQFGIIFYLWFNRNFKFRNNWLKFGLVELGVPILGYMALSGI